MPGQGNTSFAPTVTEYLGMTLVLAGLVAVFSVNAEHFLTIHHRFGR